MLQLVFMRERIHDTCHACKADLVALRQLLIYMFVTSPAAPEPTTEPLLEEKHHCDYQGDAQSDHVSGDSEDVHAAGGFRTV